MAFIRKRFNLFHAFSILILLHFVKIISSEDQSSKSLNVLWLNANENTTVTINNGLEVLCFKGRERSFFHAWRSVHLVLYPQSGHEIFSGANASEVHNKFGEQRFWHPNLWFSESPSHVDFPAFSQYCVGIAKTDSVSVFLKVKTINYWKALQTATGVFLFLFAPSLSRNSFFHYTSGVSAGVLASVLILVYILSRFMPKKSISYGVLIFGYSFCLYLLKVMWKELNSILLDYYDFVLAYGLCSAFISFVVCYRLGPVKDVRTFNLIQWSMQISAILLVYFSSEYRELSTAAIVMMMSIRAIPRSWIVRCQRTWYLYFPPRIKLLSEMEYIEQGHIETKKALENLKKYCSSPDCNVWKTVSKLKDPLRFAEFIESGSHCTDEELLRYNSESFDGDENLFSDDSDDEPQSRLSIFRNGKK